MRTHVHEGVHLGDLFVAAFDQARLYTTDPEQVSHLAAWAVMRFLRRRRRRPFQHGRRRRPFQYDRLYASVRHGSPRLEMFH